MPRQADAARARFMAHVHDVTAAALTKMAEFRDTETGAHLVRMRSYTQIIAEELGCHGPYANRSTRHFSRTLSGEPVARYRQDRDQRRDPVEAGRLTREEFETMKQHTTIGANILDHMALGAPDASFLGMAAIVARFHHERFDGRGYPVGLRHGDSAARADRGDRRCLRCDHLAQAVQGGTSAAAARDIIQRDSGSHFDPVVVEAFLQCFDDMANVHKQGLNQAQVVIGANSFLTEQLAAAGV